MTIALPLFFEQLRARLWGRKEKAPAPEVNPEHSRSIQLNTYLPVQATRVSQSRQILLMATDLSQTTLTFKTNAPVLEGEMLQVEFLMQGVGTVKVSGHVDWTLKTSRGLTGHISLWTRPEHKKSILAFTNRQKSKQR